MQLFKENRTLLIISLIMIVNTLGYGIIIPIQYSYGLRFNLSDFEQGMLFALFSLCQFISTPIIGRLSDKYGRRPLLVVSLFGTALSFVMMAFAPNALFLFLARALDGLTAGNVPVASAVIADSTKPEDRAKGFGVIGAAFSFGFIFGPLITTLTAGYSIIVPFLIAATIAAISSGLAFLYLPETNKHTNEIPESKLFDFSKLWRSLFEPGIGKTFLITLFYMTAFSMFIYAFQAFSKKVLLLSDAGTSSLFVVSGIIGLSQMFLTGWASKKFGLPKTYLTALFVVSLTFLGMFFSRNYFDFVIAIAIMSLFNSMVMPLTSAILSQEVDAKSQGSMMGLNASYASIGQIIGPVLAGAVAVWGVGIPFIGATFFIMVCFYLATQVVRIPKAKESAF